MYYTLLRLKINTCAEIYIVAAVMRLVVKCQEQGAANAD